LPWFPHSVPTNDLQEFTSQLQAAAAEKLQLLSQVVDAKKRAQAVSDRQDAAEAAATAKLHRRIAALAQVGCCHCCVGLPWGTLFAAAFN